MNGCVSFFEKKQRKNGVSGFNSAKPLEFVAWAKSINFYSQYTIIKMPFQYEFSWKVHVGLSADII